MSSSHYEKCGACGKDILDRAGAKLAARSLRRTGKGRAKAYPCAFGDHWHVTGSPRGRRRS